MSMVRSDREPSLPADVLEQAAQWFVLLGSGDVGDEECINWQRWRSADPVHEQAWMRIENIGAAFAAVPPQRTSVALHALTRKPTIRRTLASLAVAALFGLTGWQGYRASDWSADAISAVGQQRELRLDDSSRLVLDTGSAIDIAFDDEQRLLHLRRGRIYIETGHNATDRERPFVVTTRHGRIIALGTQFTVERLAEASRVAVVESRVAVRSGDAADVVVIVEQGSSVLFDSNGVRAQSTIGRNDSTWQRGMLIANDMPLSELLAALGRYRSDELVCDPEAAQLRISGAFPLRDTDRALAALTETLPVKIEQTDGRLLVRQK